MGDETMPKNSITTDMKPATTMEGRENQLIALAMQRAEERLRDGTASSQEIVHFLKLGSTKERLEKEILEKQAKLLEAKTENFATQKDIKAMYQEALEAMKSYTGKDDLDDQDLY